MTLSHPPVTRIIDTLNPIEFDESTTTCQQDIANDIVSNVASSHPVTRIVESPGYIELNEESTPYIEEVVVVTDGDVASSPPPVTPITDIPEPIELEEDSTSYHEESLVSPSIPIHDDIDDDDVFVFNGPGPTTRNEDFTTHPRFGLSRPTPPSTALSTTNVFIEQ